MAGFEYKELSDFIGKTFECTSCGKAHTLDIDNIVIDSGVINHIPQYIERYHAKKVMIIADNNTYEIAGKTVETSLSNAGYHVVKYVFQCGDKQLVPDETAIGKVVIAAPVDTDLVLAVGSGTINDISRFLSFKLHIPYAIIATAPSMDGFTSTVSPLIVNSLKTTYEAVGPRAVIADLDIMKNAPAKMIAAGLGDVLGKYTCLCDWQLSKIINGESFCQNINDLVVKAIEKCTDDVQGLVERKPSAIKSLMEGLVLSGIAMSYAGNSRPASGAEHHLAHFWEMMFLFEGKEAVLHGTKVGITTVAILKIFELIQKITPDFEKAKRFVEEFDNTAFELKLREIYGDAAEGIIEANAKEQRTSVEKHHQRLEVIKENWTLLMDTIKNLVPTAEFADRILVALGAAHRPADVGVSKEIVHNSLMYAKEIRTRYTVLQLLWDIGMLEEFADQVTDFMTEESSVCTDSETAKKKIEQIKCFILDMDGTFYLGDRLLEGSIEFLNKVKEVGKEYRFYTNNSSKNSELYHQKLIKMHCPDDVGEVLISNSVIIKYLKDHTDYKTAFILGTDYLKQDFEAAGFVITADHPDVVIVGFDTTLNYENLTIACDLIRNGTPAYGVNPDFNCPVEGGFIPDCGSIAALIKASTGVELTFFGKPSRYTLDYVLDVTGYQENEIAFVGDRLYTDIAVGKGTDCTTILVLSGETTPDMLRASDIQPTLVLEGLKDIIPLLHK